VKKRTHNDSHTDLLAQSDNFKAHWRQYISFSLRNTIWRFRDCLGP